MKCPECQDTNSRFMEGEIICGSCGLVLEDSPTEHSNKEMSYASDPRLAVAGTHQYEGRIVKSAWLYTTQEKNLQKTQRRIQLIVSRIKAPERVGTEAMLLFQKAVRKGINRGRDNQSLAYACVYAACLIHGIPKTALEITAYTSLPQTKMLRTFKVLVRALKIQLPRMKPIDLLPRFGSRLELSHPTIGRAGEILEKIKGKGIRSGKKPQTIVAAALYLATKECNEPRTQRQVANTIGVIEVTIRKRAQEIQQALEGERNEK